MSGINKAIIVGNLGADPEVRYTQDNTAVATISVATSEKWKDANGEQKEKTEWHRIVAWGKTAENAQKYLSKGSKIYVEGPIETRSWEDKDGVTRYTTEIKALKLQFLDSKGSGGGSGVPHPAGQPGKPQENQNANQPMDSNVDLNKSNFDDLDDDLPF